MLKYLLRRTLELVLTLVLASFVVFMVTEFSPGNVARKTLGPFALQQQVDVLYEKLHLNDPLLIRYVRWLGVLTGTRSRSIAGSFPRSGFQGPARRAIFR